MECRVIESLCQRCRLQVVARNKTASACLCLNAPHVSTRVAEKYVCAQVFNVESLFCILLADMSCICTWTGFLGRWKFLVCAVSVGIDPPGYIGVLCVFTHRRKQDHS